ncbi:MAG: hypothetical protein ACR2HX_08570 [Pyrinomonadaceae bacterium]
MCIWKDGITTISQQDHTTYNAGAGTGLAPISAVKTMTPGQAEARKLATFLETGQMLAGTFELKDARPAHSRELNPPTHLVLVNSE